MLAWLQGIWESISGFFEWIWGYFEWLFTTEIKILKFIGNAISFVWGMVNVLPEVFIIPGYIIILILFAYLLLNRQAGGD